MSETMRTNEFNASDHRLNDFALWAQEMEERQVAPSSEDFERWEEEFADEAGDKGWDEAIDPETAVALLDEESLERQILENPDEPQTAWAESELDGTVTEVNYRQQCYWVIGQFGHAMDTLKKNIATDEEAEEWLQMKMTIAAAKSEADPYRLMEIRSTMIPIWDEYISRMNVDWEEFQRVSNK